MNKNFKWGWITLILFFFVFQASAQKNRPKPKSTKGNLIDFEADVIEGQRKDPNIFVQLDQAKVDMDTIIYQRKDFMDFHKLERKRRFRFIDSK